MCADRVRAYTGRVSCVQTGLAHIQEGCQEKLDAFVSSVACEQMMFLPYNPPSRLLVSISPF